MLYHDRIPLFVHSPLFSFAGKQLRFCVEWISTKLSLLFFCALASDPSLVGTSCKMCGSLLPHAKPRPGSQFVCPVVVPLPNTVLSWAFSSSYYDVDFTVLKVFSDKDPEVVMEMETYSPDTLHRGDICFSKCGTYHLIWDNSNSWLREKAVTYSLNLKVPAALPENRTLCSSYGYSTDVMK